LITVEIFDPNVDGGTYDAVNNTWTSTRSVVWTGKARMQAVRSASNRQGTLNPTSVQEVELHISMRGNTLDGAEGTVPEIRPGLQAFITDSPYDETLESYILNVRSSVTTSNPWGRMLLCEIDEEAKRDNS